AGAAVALEEVEVAAVRVLGEQRGRIAVSVRAGQARVPGALVEAHQYPRVPVPVVEAQDGRAVLVDGDLGVSADALAVPGRAAKVEPGPPVGTDVEPRAYLALGVVQL